MTYGPEIHRRIVESVKNGAFITEACALVRINPATHYRWVARGKLGEEPYATYLKDIEEAKSQSIEDMKKLIKTAAIKDWRAAAWLLEKRDKPKYGPNIKVDQTDEQKALENMSEEQIDKFMADKGWVRKDAGSTGNSDSE